MRAGGADRSRPAAPASPGSPRSSAGSGGAGRWQERDVDALVVASRGVWTRAERRASARRLRALARPVQVISDTEAAYRGALGDAAGRAPARRHRLDGARPRRPRALGARRRARAAAGRRGLGVLDRPRMAPRVEPEPRTSSRRGGSCARPTPWRESPRGRPPCCAAPAPASSRARAPSSRAARPPSPTCSSRRRAASPPPAHRA